jgi:hypothetical protein
MNALLASSPVTSQVLNVSRHSLACGDFRLKAPLVTSSMKPRSWSSANARAAVPRAMLHRSEAWRTDNPIWPLFLPLYGTFQGVVTNADILESIVGSFHTEEGPAEPAESQCEGQRPGPQSYDQQRKCCYRYNHADGERSAVNGQRRRSKDRLAKP